MNAAGKKSALAFHWAWTVRHSPWRGPATLPMRELRSLGAPVIHDPLVRWGLAGAVAGLPCSTSASQGRQPATALPQSCQQPLAEGRLAQSQQFARHLPAAERCSGEASLRCLERPSRQHWCSGCPGPRTRWHIPEQRHATESAQRVPIPVLRSRARATRGHHGRLPRTLGTIPGQPKPRSRPSAGRVRIPPRCGWGCPPPGP